MSKGIKLGEFKEHYERERAEIKKENKERLKNLDFSAIETGARTSEMSAVEAINVVSAENGKASVYVEFTEDRGGGNETFAVTTDGVVSGRVPGGADIDRVKLEKAIVEALEQK